MGYFSSSKKTQKSSTAPWQPQQPYLEHGFSEAQRLYQNHPQKYYPKSTVAPFSADQKAGMAMTRQIANSDMTNSFEQGVFNDVQRRVMPSVNSQFMSSGRFGGGLHADTAARAMTESWAPMAAQFMQQGIDNRYRAAGAMQGIGQQQQGLAQRELDDAVQRWNYYQDLPWNKLRQYQSAIQGNYGGTSSQDYYKPSTLSQIIGGVLSLGGVLG